RERGTSISFNSHATLDDGMQHSIDEPLPKIGSNRRRDRVLSITGSSGDDDSTGTRGSDGESPRINPFTREPVRRRTRRSDMLPRLDPIESGQGQEQDMPSLTSESTSSPFFEALDTPISASMAGSLLLSPRATGSPIMSPSRSSAPWPMSARETTKSRVSSRQASLRNSSRRSSRMSASSPATAFLSQWGKESLASLAPDPDDEGQTIGLNNEYIIGRQVGYGGFSVVKELHGMSEDGEKIRRTVKIVRKNIPTVSEHENDRQQQAIEHEVSVWRYVQHEHILPLYAVYDTDFATFCVMDLVEGGTLFDLVRKYRNTDTKGLNPSLAKHYAYQLASALRYLHEDIRLVHRDIKLENCLLDLTGQEAETKGGKLKLCDFGLADFISNDMLDSIESLDLNDSTAPTAADVAGTLQYAAPENFSSTRQLLQPSLDVWAFGVCVYTMVTGVMPFNHSLQPKVIEMISEGKWNKDMVRDAVAAPDAEQIIDVLDGCLEVDSNLRWNISDVMACKWFEDLQR
ncbi:kinase-like domain-containing protein, partial [Delphinella strobiligena]